jgi:hypothetical protein
LTGLTVAGTSGILGHGVNQLYSPYSLAFDISKALYIAEWTGCRVSKWSMEAAIGATVAGQSSGTPSTASNAFSNSGDVVLDSNDNLYAADTGNHRI